MSIDIDIRILWILLIFISLIAFYFISIQIFSNSDAEILGGTVEVSSSARRNSNTLKILKELFEVFQKSTSSPLETEDVTNEAGKRPAKQQGDRRNKKLQNSYELKAFNPFDDIMYDTSHSTSQPQPQLQLQFKQQQHNSNSRLFYNPNLSPQPPPPSRQSSPRPQPPPPPPPQSSPRPQSPPPPPPQSSPRPQSPPPSSLRINDDIFLIDIQNYKAHFIYLADLVERKENDEDKKKKFLHLLN